MAKSGWELWALLIGILEFNINYFVYIRTKSLLDIFIIVGASLFFALVFIISHIYTRLKETSDTLDDLDKRLKWYKEFEDIRLDMREVKKKVFGK